MWQHNSMWQHNTVALLKSSTRASNLRRGYDVAWPAQDVSRVRHGQQALARVRREPLHGCRDSRACAGCR